MEGIIKKLTDKHFGFIAQEGGNDLFFHANNLQGVDYTELKEGDKVSFEIETTPKGDSAVNVQRA
ncbi:cold shock domain-containing protein [bacterium]|nr:cold shock domain-containing protein [bacterium]